MRSRLSLGRGLAWWVVAVGLAGGSAWGTTISVSHPYEQYGHLWNTDDGTSTGNPVGWCAATSLANSFQYLVTHNPDIYKDKSLIQGSLLDTRNKLNGGWDFGGQHRAGIAALDTGDKGEWESKAQWIEDYAPGTTVIRGVIGGEQDITTWAHNKNLTHAFPTAVSTHLFDRDLPIRGGMSLNCSRRSHGFSDGIRTWSWRIFPIFNAWRRVFIHRHR